MRLLLLHMPTVSGLYMGSSGIVPDSIIKTRLCLSILDLKQSIESKTCLDNILRENLTNKFLTILGAEIIKNIEEKYLFKEILRYLFVKVLGKPEFVYGLNQLCKNKLD